MPVSNNLLLWTVKVIDAQVAHGEDILQLRTELDNLRFTIQRTANLTGIEIPDEIQSVLADMQHASIYIMGARDIITHTGGPILNTGPRSIVPNQFDQSFAGQKAIHIEHLVAESTAKGMENVKHFANVNSVDIIHKGDFETTIEKPKPGEVENFVAKREMETATEGEVYSSIDELKALYKIAPAEDYVLGNYHVLNYSTPVQYDFLPGYPTVTSSVTTETPIVSWFGYDAVKKELVIVENNDISPYQLSAIELLDFASNTIPHYNGRVIHRFNRKLEKEFRAGDGGKIQVTSLDLGGGVILVTLVGCGGDSYTFTTTRTVFDKYYN